MPDLDIIDWIPATGWYRACRLLEGAADADLIASEAVKALCRSLRGRGGMPGMRELASIVGEYWAGTLPGLNAFDRIREVERLAHGHRHSLIGGRATGQLLAGLTEGPANWADVGAVGAVAEGFCWAAMDYYLFGRVRPRLSCGDQSDPGAIRALESRCKDLLRAAVSAIARRLVQRPDGVGLRAASVGTKPRLSTSEVLDMSLDSFGSEEA